MNKIDITVTQSVDIPPVDLERKQITLTTQIADEVTRRVVCMEDEAVRAVLIAMGWIPPEVKEYVFTAHDVEDNEEVGEYSVIAESKEIAFRIIAHVEEFDSNHYYILSSVEEV